MNARCYKILYACFSNHSYPLHSTLLLSSVHALPQVLHQACESTGKSGIHLGTKAKPLNLVSINGPRFSTRTESNIYRQWGLHVINMTTVPEAQLACEAEIAYSVLNHVTDYDCWHESEDDVTASNVFAQLMQNIEGGEGEGEGEGEDAKYRGR